MDLDNLLMNLMGSDDSVEALAQKSGSTTKDASSFISSALPMLLGQLTQNASSESGASSLLNALTQHTDTSSMAQQLTNADEQDGSAIIQHIFGDNSSSAVSTLSAETGIADNQVSSLLSTIAPALLSGISAATTSAQNSEQSSGGFDFSSLLGLFGGSGSSSNATASSGGSDLISMLLGSLG